tara:strand:+ start:17835 stop:17963 length:129 start_codon:yes stop_codon:yes gene_type:complete
MPYLSRKKTNKKRAPKGYHFVKGGDLIRNRSKKKKKKRNALR